MVCPVHSISIALGKEGGSVQSQKHILYRAGSAGYMLSSYSKMSTLTFFLVVLQPKKYASGPTVSYMINVLPASSLVQPSC